MLVIEKPKTHIIRGMGRVKNNKKYVKGRGFVDIITTVSKLIPTIASATSGLVTIGKNTAEVISKIRNRFKKKEQPASKQQDGVDNLIDELKSGRGFQYV